MQAWTLWMKILRTVKLKNQPNLNYSNNFSVYLIQVNHLPLVIKCLMKSKVMINTKGKIRKALTKNTIKYKILQK